MPLTVVLLLFSLFEEREILVRKLVFVTHIIFTKFQEIDAGAILALGTLITFLPTLNRADFTDAYFLKRPTRLNRVFANARVSPNHLTSLYVVVLKVFLVDLEMFQRASELWFNRTVIRSIDFLLLIDGGGLFCDSCQRLRW